MGPVAEIISRHAWGAMHPRFEPVTIQTPTIELWLHHSAGALDAGNNGVWWDDVQGIQRFHMAPPPQGRGWNDIAYSFIIGGGQIFEGRGVGIAGAHTPFRNSLSHGICIIGNYEFMQPHGRDLDALVRLIIHGKRNQWWGDLTGPHRDAPGSATSCCGRNLIARIPDIRARANLISTTNADPLEDDDMLMVRHPTGATVLLAGGRLGGIKAAADARALTAAGVPLVDVTDATWQEWHVKFGAKS